jgi:hypothetical protein
MRRAAFLLATVLLAGGAGPAPWDSFHVILWQADRDPAALATAKSLGVTDGRIVASRSEPVDTAELRREAAPIEAAGLGFYVENIATDYYSPYHRFIPGHSPIWEMDKLRALRRVSPHDPALFVRQPGLEDPAWQNRIAARLAATAGVFGAAPLFYNLADESGIADLASAWDFDTAPPSLALFRQWLRDRYGSLAALDRAWGTAHARWAEVEPELTDTALARTDGNYTAWSDFKAFMDSRFAAAVARGTQALHQANPGARSGLEGMQPLGWGGYDWARLAGTADVFEIYDFFGSIATARGFDPHAVLLTTAFAGPPELRMVWREALRGTSGVVIWDDPSIVGRDGKPSARGLALAPAFRALTGELGRRIIAAPEPPAPIGILVSQESFRLAWLLARRGEKSGPGEKQDWAQRSSGDEDDDATPARRALVALLHSLAERGLRPVMLTDAMVARGGLRGLKVLAMPQVLALSDAAAAAIRGFASAGGTVAADIGPGAYDASGRKRSALPLAGMKLLPLGDAASLLAAPVSVLDGNAPAADVEIHVREEGTGLLVSVQSTGGGASGGGPGGGRTRRLVLKAPGRRLSPLYPVPGPETAGSVSFTLGPALPEIVAVR